MTPLQIRIATRKSPLALWQANFVAQQLLAKHDHLSIELILLSTRGDQILDRPLAKVGGKGLFVKELEQALFDGSADIAVHSMKDVPMVLPEGLMIAAICQRADARDAFVSNHYSSLAALPAGSRVGTSSLRRQCQLNALRPDLTIKSLRGNVQTRLNRLDTGEFDAIILASAGLERLGLSARITSYLPVEMMLPAAGQGAIGVECRSQDSQIRELLATINDPITQQCVNAERAMSQQLDGNCQVPIAGYALLQGDRIWLRGLVGSPSGETVLRVAEYGSVADPAALGQRVAQQLVAQGANALLSDALLS